MTQNRIVITVDGFAGSGKTTISRLLAERLQCIHFNSGMLYRVAGLLASDAGASLEDETRVMRVLGKHSISLDLLHNRKTVVRIDGAEFHESDRLTAPETSEAASLVARHKAVRDYLREQQQTVFPGRNLVAEGRDMGTVIFPDAPLKFFIQASEDIRAERRLAQLLPENASISEREELKKALKIEVLDRDFRDRQRENSPTVAAPDAVIIENNGPSLTQIVETMYDFATRRGLVSNLVK